MTDRELHQRATALFLELKSLSQDERTKRLAAVQDPLLIEEVRTLLEHDDEDALNEPSVARPGNLPAKIGPYTILRRLGHGGSGYVLLAEQLEPVRRKVAIKIVPHAAVSPDFAARFEFERRALERTDHPNIAHILDAGRTADGLPYLVLEYVEGTPVTNYCRDKGLSLRDRIDLVLDVADAVQHAHQRGVIHRDLKPANILVSDAIGKPLPRVLDFGIAKPTADTAQDESPPTSGLPLGTPSYMAPEQTGGQPVDTRADIYALGAVLYELACGRPPVDARGEPLEVLRRIREVNPTPASRIRAELASELANEAVGRSFLTDLDCILAKSLEKQPSRRYPTVSALIEDLNRLLRREPIEAHPPSLRYRAARFVQRNRGLAASIGVGAIAVIVGISGLTAGLIEARIQRREASNQGDAQREINRFLTDDLLAAASPDQEGDKVTALDLLHRASRRIDSRFPNRPLIAAAIHHVLGTAYTELGAFDDADRHLSAAISLRKSAAGIDAPDTVRSEVEFAGLLLRRQKYPEAEAALKQAVDRARLILGPDDPSLYRALNDLGMTYEGQDQATQAIAFVQEALAGRIRLLGPRDPVVLITMSNLAMAYDRAGKTDRALELDLEAMKIADALDDPPRMVVIGLCNNIGATYQDLNRDKEAEPYLRRAADVAGKLLGPENPDTLTLQGNLAGLETKLGNPMRGAEMYKAILDIRMRTMGPGAYDTLTTRFGYFDSLWHAKKFDEAAKGFAELVPDASAAIGDKHWLTIQTRVLLAHALRDAGHPDKALEYAQLGTDQFAALYGAEHPRTRNAAALLSRIKAQLASPSSSGAPQTPAEGG